MVLGEEGILEVGTIVMVKRHLVRHMNMQGLQGYRWTDGASLTWHHGQHGHCGAK